MNAGALTGMTGRSWSGIGRDMNANGTIGISIVGDLQKMSLNCLTSYPTFA
ncbi:hypothetical protein [Peribacillus simplex]|uniref:hypothetical protein n=1 Tax=Peribacillus simplex TaxID=1478 RepID=UPI001624DE44|nr:hypothetical protein [Peribacillus simplex]